MLELQYTGYMSSNLQPIAISSVPALLPLAGCSVRAGFPSPADDFAAQRIDLTTVLIKHPQATFLLRVAGESMREAGIDDGDLIVVDRALTASHGCIVVAVVDGEFTVKYLHQRFGRVKLRAANPTYPDIVPKDGQTIELWGVVTSCIKQFRT